MPNDLIPFFNPRGVAIIGASSNPAKLSFGIIKNLTSFGYQGRIYPVNPNAREILGLPCYPDVGSVPDPVDLAVSVVSNLQTPAVLEACGQRGIRAVTIISGGFREVGPEGAALEQKCVEIARRYQIRLVGPNCVGTMDLHSGLDTTFILGVPQTGRIGFLSQSGAICGGIVDYVRGKQVGFSNFVSLGNMADVSETDMIEYLETDPNTRVITLYVEGIQDGRRFLEIARRVTKKKPIVILKAGKTQDGSKAVSSHTGSIAGSNAAYQTAFRQAGVIEAGSVADLFDIALAFDLQPIPDGNRAVLLTNSGGPAALASDSLAENGLKLASLSAETQASLRAKLNPSAQVGNPVDMLGGAEPQDYAMGLEASLKDPGVDMVVPILVPTALVHPAEVASEIVRVARGSNKPVAACMMGDAAVVEARSVLHRGGVPMYSFPETIGTALGAMKQHSEWVRQELPVFEAVPDCSKRTVDELLGAAKGKQSLGEIETRDLLAAYGIPLVGGRKARTCEEAGAAAEALGGAVVMKIISPDILHKSDSGGVRLHIKGREEAEMAFDEMMAVVRQRAPGARIEGVLIEKMAPSGQEVILGMRRDPSFGPMLMFGLGGIYVELFGDVAFRIAPVTAEEALTMIRETKAGKLLSGFRGQAAGDLGGVVECIRRLGQLALDFPAIQEIEINPLVVYPAGQGVLALDCRAIL